MKRTILTASSLLIFFALSSHSNAADLSDRGWSLRATALTAQSTGGGGFNSSLGWGLGLEYRATPHLGVELAVLNDKVDSEIGLSFFDTEVFTIESSLRMTPVLARLNWHLTPGHKVDLYLGPIAGWMRYGDLNVRIRGAIVDGGSILVDHVETKDGFAWGGHLGFDVPIGERGLFFTAGATYLKATVKPDESEIDPEIDPESGPEDFDLDPFIVQAGFGYRF